jgi:predicted amidohydrolase
MIVACVQMNSGKDKEANLNKAEQLVTKAAELGAQLIVLPEYFNFRGPDEEKSSNAEPIPGRTSTWAQAAARRTGAYLLAGSFLESGPDSPEGKFFNTSLLLDPSGNVVAQYRKMHLFDAMIGSVGYRESAVVHPGNRPVIAETGFATVGLSICYDLRFPELYMYLAACGAKMIFLPANFTLQTGKDHWEVLLRARAIENQVYMVAAAQVGQYAKQKISYGRSMIVDPWGVILAQAPDVETVIAAHVDFDYQNTIRQRLPVLHHKRSELGLKLAF